MSAVVAGTKAKLQNLLPGRIGSNNAFSDSYVEELIMAGFHEAAEACSLVVGTESVALANDTLVYDLAEPFIEITQVEWFDGSNRKGHLTCATLSDLDKMSRKWWDSTGAESEFYSLLSAPGIPETSTDAADGSRILVWRPVTDATDLSLLVTGFVCGTTTTPISEDVQRMCIVPYVLSHLNAVANPNMAAGYLAQFESGCDIVRGRFSHRYDEPTYGV